MRNPLLGSRRRLLARLMLGSLRRRWRRTRVALAAVTLSGALVAAALTVAVSIGLDAGRALRAYGANLLVLPAGDAFDGTASGYLPISSVVALTRIPSAQAIRGAVPLLFTLARVDAAPTVLVGTHLEAARRVNPWWRFRPDVPGRLGPSAAVVGEDLARASGVRPGDRVTVRVGPRRATLTVRSVLTTGGAEDNQLLVDLATAQRLAGRPGVISQIQVSAAGHSGSVDGIAAEIARVLPDARVQAIRQLVVGEQHVVRRVELLLALIAAVVAVAAGISVAATMSALAVERRGELALMKAMGAGDAAVSGLFLLEAGSIGLAGGVAGFVLGWVLAQVVGRAMWAAPAATSGAVLLATLLVAGLTAVASSLIPARRAMVVEPATVLRGE